MTEFTLPQSGILTDVEWARVFDETPKAFRARVRDNGVPYVQVNRGIIVDADDLYRFAKVVFDRATGATRRLEDVELTTRSHRLSPVEKAKLIQVACQMLPEWKANTAAIARELGICRKMLERSPIYRRARAIECSPSSRSKEGR